MKCNKCGFENIRGAEFCSNCGNRLIQQLSTSQSSKKKNNKKLFAILGILLGIVAIVITIILIVNKLNKFEDPFEDIDDLTFPQTIVPIKNHQEINSFTKKIEEDYLNGTLSSDEYIMQLAYSIFDVDKINYKYKSLAKDFNEPVKLFEKFANKIDDLSNDTIKYLFENYTLSDVLWNAEDVPNVIGTNNLVNGKFDYKAKALVNEDADVSKLDNVKLSSNENFLIYYTKDGINAITDSDADKIATFLESIVLEYKEKYNLDFKYEAQYNFSSGTSECPLFGVKGKVCKLLKNNNIDTKYLNTAMPVYIIDTNADNTKILGYYIPPISSFAKVILKISDIFEDNGTQIDNITTAYSLPFFVVSSSLDDFDNTKIVLAHELFHHYQKYICGNGEYVDCVSGDFTVETTANLAAIQVVGVNKIDTVMNHHSWWYINDIELSIDEVGEGYGAFVFATNYANMVDGGIKHWFNSMKTTDALKYIYDNANGKYRDVLLYTAEKNLTLDYSNKLLIAYKDGNIAYPPNHANIGNQNTIKSETINYSSMHYYYINPKDYDVNTQLSFSSNSNNINLLLFVADNNTYKYLYTHPLDKEFIINIDDFSYYQEVAIAIVDFSISGISTYNYEIDNNGNKNPTVTAESLSLQALKDKIDEYSSFVCHYVEDDNEYRTVTQIKLSFDKKDKINDMYFKGTIQIKNYNPDDRTFAIGQKIVSGLLYVMQHAYEEQFKYFKVFTTEGTDKYSVTFKITKNYYDALNNSLKINAKTKYDIVKIIEAEGYTCQYQK